MKKKQMKFDEFRNKIYENVYQYIRVVISIFFRKFFILIRNIYRSRSFEEYILLFEESKLELSRRLLSRVVKNNKTR